ncbi:hypothetical protein SLA2020_355830 [Shorea laevis]
MHNLISICHHNQKLKRTKSYSCLQNPSNFWDLTPKAHNSTVARTQKQRLVFTTLRKDSFFSHESECFSKKTNSRKQKALDNPDFREKGNSLAVLEKTARRRAQISKKPNQTEANRREPTSINHHPNAFIFAFLSLYLHCCV